MFVVKSWQLRKIIDVHTCNRDFNVKLINVKWLSKNIEKIIRENSQMTLTDYRDKVINFEKLVASGFRSW